MTAILEVRGLTVAFGGVVANRDVDLEVEEGSLTGLIGPNGAGKTTLLDAVTGHVACTGGTVRFGGEDVSRASPHRRARAGMVRTFQSLELFNDLSVRDNLLVALENSGRSSERPEDEVIAEAMTAFGIAGFEGKMPSSLSQGTRKMVALARALASSPRLLLLDEPVAGLDSRDTRALGLRLRTIVDTGVSVLLVDHDMDLIMDVCDTIHVLQFGELIATGTPDQVRANPRVVDAYLGGAHVG